MENSVGCDLEISCKKDIIATGNVFCKQKCTQGGSELFSLCAESPVLFIKYKIKTVFNF